MLEVGGIGSGLKVAINKNNMYEKKNGNNTDNLNNNKKGDNKK